MSASNAGLNRVQVVALSLNPSATAVTTPLAAYGATGFNDSGMMLNEAANFSTFTFSLIGTTTGYTVTCYGTNDPAAVGAWRKLINPGQYTSQAALPASSWFILPGPSEQSGTGTIANPMTSANPLFTAKLPLLAVRVALTNTAGATGNAQVVITATP